MNVPARNVPGISRTGEPDRSPVPALPSWKAFAVRFLWVGGFALVVSKAVLWFFEPELATMPQGSKPWFEAAVALVLMFTAGAIFILRPLLKLFPELHQRIQQIRTYSKELEKRLQDRDAEMAAAHNALQAERDLRIQKENEWRGLAAENESRLAKQNVQWETLRQEWEAKAAASAHETTLARTREDRLRHLIDLAVESCVCVVDTSGRTEMVNQRAAEIFGRPATELVGSKLGDLICLQDLPEWLRSLDCRSAEAARPVEFRLRASPEPGLKVRGCFKALHVDGGDRAGLVIVFAPLNGGQGPLAVPFQPAVELKPAGPPRVVTPPLDPDATRALAACMAQELVRALSPPVASAQLVSEREPSRPADLISKSEVSSSSHVPISPASPARQEPRLPEGHGETIILVEPEIGLRESSGAILRQHGYKVLCASDGFEAVGLLAQEHDMVQVLLTNIVMPGMNGADLARTARQIRPSIRVIAFTAAGKGLAETDKLTALKSLGVHQLLPKPFTRRELLEAVAESGRSNGAEG